MKKNIGLFCLVCARYEIRRQRWLSSRVYTKLISRLISKHIKGKNHNQQASNMTGDYSWNSYITNSETLNRTRKKFNLLIHLFWQTPIWNFVLLVTVITAITVRYYEYSHKIGIPFFLILKRSQKKKVPLRVKENK